jgi:hypothetical protein
MGATGAPEILATLAAVQHALRIHGYPPAGDGVSAACRVLGAEGDKDDLRGVLEGEKTEKLE